MKTRKRQLLKVLVLSGASILLVALIIVASVFALRKPTTPVLRGANINRMLSERDLRDFADAGGNVLRVSFAFKPLIKKTPPYEIDIEAFQYLDWLLMRCKKYHLRVIIDPHTAPGFTWNETTSPHDPFWQSFVWHQHLIRLWEFIAQRYVSQGDVIAGYDLLNEPNLPNLGKVNTPADYNLLVTQLVYAIRHFDRQHTIIIEPPLLLTPPHYAFPSTTENPLLASFAYLKGPSDAHIIYSPHVYWPTSFTNQGLAATSSHIATAVHYPGEINGQLLDAAALARYVAPIEDFAKTNHVDIVIGEFGTVRWLGEDGNHYLHDLIELFEQNHWGWLYQSYRSSDVWDAEMSNTNRDDTARQSNTPRAALLKKYFDKNRHTALCSFIPLCNE